MDDTSHVEQDPDAEVESLIEKLKEVDPADAPEPADALADLLSEELDGGPAQPSVAEEPS